MGCAYPAQCRHSRIPKNVHSSTTCRHASHSPPQNPKLLPRSQEKRGGDMKTYSLMRRMNELLGAVEGQEDVAVRGPVRQEPDLRRQGSASPAGHEPGRAVPLRGKRGRGAVSLGRSPCRVNAVVLHCRLFPVSYTREGRIASSRGPDRHKYTGS